jgi:predicted esterase
MRSSARLVMIAVVLSAFARAGRCEAQATTLPDTPAALHAAFIAEDIHFSRLVFGETVFPSCDFAEPRAVRTMIGPYTIKTTFYDDAQNPVTSAQKVGRYGAIVEITGADGRKYKRFVTLFRTARAFSSASAGGPFDASLPDGSGIDPSMLSSNADSINEAARDAFYDELGHDASGPRLLAWLNGDWKYAAGASGPFDSWSARNWWLYNFKMKTGNLERLRYLVYLPKDYEGDLAKKWPVLLALHGGGELGDDLELVKTTPIPRLARGGKDFPFIIIAPQCPALGDWNPWELNSLLDEVSQKYRVDEERICATGYSMGGFGVWSLACAFPLRLAAIAPLCGGCEPGAMGRIKDLAIHVFHGEDDPIVPLDLDRRCVEALKKLGSPVLFTAYPKTGHAIWTQTYANEDLYRWFLRQRRGQVAQN